VSEQFRADEFPVGLRLKLSTRDKRICSTHDARATRQHSTACHSEEADAAVIGVDEVEGSAAATEVDSAVVREGAEVASNRSVHPTRCWVCHTPKSNTAVRPDS